MKSAKKKRKVAEPKISRTFRPPDLSVDEWQFRLRRQFGREQRFKLKNLGDEAVFSDFQVFNPESGRAYRVLIRGGQPGDNHCTCPDFAVNTLGTCKHVEFVLGKLERQTGGKRALASGFAPPFSEIRLRYGAAREARFFPGTEAPAKLAGLAKRYFDDAGVLRADAFGTIDQFLRAAQEHGHDLRIYEDVLAFIAEVRDRDRRRAIIDEHFPNGIRSRSLEGLLKVELYEYQKEGALFAARAGRCLIGDEMGLGKTIQAIAAARIMSEHLGVGRVLIVCPTSLKHQWQREIERFAAIEAQVISGFRARRQQQFAAEAAYKITNYDTVHADLDLIAAWHPDLVILDEAQRIKNWKTRTARSVKQVASPYAIVLTGTPLENRLEELASIVQFVDRHRLGPTFKFLHEHQLTDEFGKVIGYKELDRIGKTLEPILIRRRKAQVLKQLPGRMDNNLFVPMTPEQLKHHNENKDTVARLVYKWRKQRFLSEADQRRLMIALQNMRMSCDSTYLLDQETDFGTKPDEIAALLEDLYESNGAKVVIFSQWVRMHELVQRRFKKRKWDHVLFTGQVPGSQRAKLIDRFREREECRAFLSTDSGGVGLNLQHASVVINADLPWNPAVLEQRIGRVHRLGQSQPVQVFNFVAQGTIEEGMLSLIKFKKSLFAGALDGGESEVFLGGSRLSKFMESVEKATSAIPDAAVEDPSTAGASTQGGDEASDEARAAPAAQTAPRPDDPWGAILAGGLTLLEQIVSTARDTRAGAVPTARPGPSIVRRDAATGENYLHIPVPKGEVMEKLLDTVTDLLNRFRAK